MDNQPVPGSEPDSQPQQVPAQAPLQQAQSQFQPQSQPQPNLQQAQSQPQPQFQPQFQPLQPIAPTTAAQATPPVSGKSKKKLIIIIASVVGALVVIGVAVAIVLALFIPTKKDYEAANTQLNNLRSEGQTLSSIGPSVKSSYLGSYDSFNENATAAKTSIAKIKDENKKLSQLKAVRYGEGADKYKAFDAKLEAYLTYTSNFVTSLANSRSAVKTCSVSSEDAENMTALKGFADSCVSALKSMGDIPDDSTKQFLNKLQTEFENYSSLISQMTTITDPYGTQYSQYLSIWNKLQDVDSNIISARNEYTASVDKHVAELNGKDVTDKLATFLEEKSR